ncbi:uncharacterized protein BDCG_07801 [Blastomyces dermatitidis ER-3]|uniref:Protein kinase domain-containing protein n=1 Tax=Ajellomyces dermatitidis (strain ER-3 / ATCC MYA-2586) TaxID=559297 RepID=A0ABP2F6E4_AJEDR|nr:uncharacterized protein BDCG_07801 [Blastomyces dermatitidis ER-3]EEQ92681.1 hypothetical protein BDCG_07801 [Blastomyces dermatitidis ER-3]
MDSRVQQLLAELEEQKRLREIAEAQVEKERGLRQEEQRRREEEQRRREEEQRRREEEQRRREEAESLTADTQLTTFLPFLRNCHELLLAIRIVTDPTRTTQGTVTKPANRRVPSRIIICDKFFARQEAVWRILNDHPLFLMKKQFPSKHQLEYVCKVLSPITAESDLRYYERETVENQVRNIVDRITEDVSLKEAFGLRGSITFDSHTNVGRPQESSLSEGGENLSINSETAPSAKAKGRGRKKKKESVTVTRGQADRFCIYRRDGDDHIPAIAIEYKAPHKLTQAEMTTGLREEIRPARDVINQESEDVTFCCRRLVAAVITQLFSYMVQKCVRYGYVCTGEAFIFVYIPDDPSSVQCALCIPGRDVKGTDDDDLQGTAVAQVLAFTIRALTSPPVPQQWSDAADELDIWPVEYSDILDQTPPAARLKHASPLYRGRRPHNLSPFRMTLRSGCRPSENKPRPTSSPSPSPPPSPSLTPHSGPRGRARRGGHIQSAKPRGTPGHGEGTQRMPNAIETLTIKTRPYCSQRCLLALRDNTPLDPTCSNYEDHRKHRIKAGEFRALVQKQLATDRGPDADCCPLYKAGSCGALLKVRLSSHGYTLVAKAVECKHKHKLRHEMKVYNELRDLQGECIPVCLGLVKLAPGRPYYYDEKIHTHILLLSWAGEPIEKYRKLNHTAVAGSTVDALEAIHSKGVTHGDAEPRNMLWDLSRQRVVIVDLERSTIRNPLSSVSTNSRKDRKLTNDDYSKELQRVKALFEGNAESSL